MSCIITYNGQNFTQEDFLDYLKSQIPASINNPSDLTNHSGGAKGGDMQGWDAIGREFGVTNHNHYTVAYYDKLTEQEKTELNKQYLETVRFLGRGVISKDTYAGKLVRRDMIQANNGESIYGVTELIKPGVKGRKGYNNKMSYSIPEGGTGYATARGILLNKPTYIFNQSDKYGNEIGWYKWDNNIEDFIKTDTPILSKNFTGIGSQEINELGLQAIRDVYEKTFNQSEQGLNSPMGKIKEGVEELFNENPKLANEVYETLGFGKETISNIYSKLGNKTKSENVVIRPWNKLKDATNPITEEGIISTRVKATDYNFGNIFSHQFGGNLIKVDTVKEAVKRYINWILTGETGEYVFTGIQPEELDAKREWILEQLKSGELKGKPIVYYKELGEPSHATALDYLINTYNWNTKITPEQKQQAIQLYSNFLDKFVKRNFDKLVSEMESKNLIEKKCD